MIRFAGVCPLRQSTQSDGGEEVDGEASVSGIVPREEAFEERLQGPETQHFQPSMTVNSKVWMCRFVFRRLEPQFLLNVSTRMDEVLQLPFSLSQGLEQCVYVFVVHVFESLVEFRQTHVGAELLEKDLDENPAGGRCGLLAHPDALQHLMETHTQLVRLVASTHLKSCFENLKVQVGAWRQFYLVLFWLQ